MAEFTSSTGDAVAASPAGPPSSSGPASSSSSSSSHHQVFSSTINYVMATAHEEMNPRRRNTMEDVHRIIPSLPGAPEYSYFGVYDGHGGRQIVDFLEEGLEINVSKELQEGDDAGILERMSRAFLITDMQSRRLNITTSGATAVTALLRTEKTGDKVTKKMLYVANVGDSRAVIVTSDKPCGDNSGATYSPSGYLARRLSFDHRAEDPGEQQRIKDAGGFITRGRVLGILAVSRSFGDHGMKDFVTADPYTTETDLLTCCQDGSADCPILILACDGVWDVLSDQEAADMILERFKAEGPFEGAAQLLVDTAIAKGSADNITALVIFL